MLKQHNWIDIKLLQNYNKISKVALHRVFYRIIVPNHALQNRVEKVRKFQRMTPEIESFYSYSSAVYRNFSELLLTEHHWATVLEIYS